MTIIRLHIVSGQQGQQDSIQIRYRNYFGLPSKTQGSISQCLTVVVANQYIM